MLQIKQKTSVPHRLQTEITAPQVRQEEDQKYLYYFKCSMTKTGYKGGLSKPGGTNKSLTHRTCIMPNTRLGTSSTQVRNQQVNGVWNHSKGYKPHPWAWHYYETGAFKASKIAALKNGFQQQWTKCSAQILLVVLTSIGLLLSTKVASQGEVVHVTTNYRTHN